MNQTDANPPRRLRLFLRDHRVLDANALVPRGQFLSTYLASRNRYVNLTGISWLGTGETVPHMALKVDKILWAASEDGELALTSARAAVSARRVEVELEGGYLLSAGLLLVPNQRLTDYLQSAPAFVPLQEAELRPRDKTLGDVVVNQQAIQVVREVGTGEEEPAAGTIEEEAQGPPPPDALEEGLPEASLSEEASFGEGAAGEDTEEEGPPREGAPGEEAPESP